MKRLYRIRQGLQSKLIRPRGPRWEYRRGVFLALLIATSLALIVPPAAQDVLLAALFTAVAGAGLIFLGTGTFASIAAFTLNVIAGTILSFALSKVTAALVGKPKTPKVTPFGIQGSLRTGGDVPRSILVGRCATAGTLVWANSWGQIGDTPNAYLTQVIALSDMPIRGVTKVYVNGETVTLGAGTLNSANHDSGKGVPITEYSRNGVDHLWVKIWTGQQTIADPFLTNTASSSGRVWASTRVGVGVAYAVVTARFNRDIFTGIPQWRFEADGLALYDPSRDTTAGGSGSHRWDTPATWDDATDSRGLAPVLLYNLLRGIRYSGEWVMGLQGLSAAQLPSSSWVAAINAARTAGFKAGGELAYDTELGDTIEAILASCEGRLADNAGTSYTLTVGASGSAVATFTDDDIITTAEQSFTPFPGLASTINGIIFTYPRPSQAWNVTQAPPIYDAELEAEDGDRRLPVTIEMPMVSDDEQAQRLAKAALAEARRARRHTITLPPKFWALEPGDIISWTSERNGYDSKLFRVDGVVDLPNLDVLVDLTETDPSDYDWNTVTDFQPQIDGFLGAVRPTTQSTSVTVEAAAINDSFGARRPAIKLLWSNAPTDVVGIDWQVRLTATAVVVSEGSAVAVEGTSGSTLISQGVLSVTSYQVRARWQPGSARPVEWSSWLSVTTGDYRLTAADLGPATVDVINLTQAARDLIGGEGAAVTVAAEAARDAAQAAQGLAEDARDAATNAATAASGSAANALADRILADAAALTAQSASSAAGASQVLANADAIAAEAAKLAAQQARTDASGFATTASGASSTATTQANSATTQAGLATTKANEAGASATAAAASAVTASTQAGIATTQAGVATTKAAEASTSAANAQTAQTVTARVGGGNVVVDPYGATFASATSWQRWTGTGNYYEVPNEVYSFGKTHRFVTVGTENAGFYLNAAAGAPKWNGPINALAYVMEVDFTLVSGGLGGVYMRIDWNTLDAGEFYTQVRFDDALVGGLTLGVPTKVAAVIKRPSNFTGTFASHDVYVFANYGVGVSAKDIRFHRVTVRPATAEEAGSGQIGIATTAAANSASAANASKTDAQAAASSATTMRNEAVAARDAASGSASAAASSASTATTKATEAGNSATAATAARVSAESARDAASGSATAAVSSANSASTSATNAGNSATAAAASAVTASTQAGIASSQAGIATTKAAEATAGAASAASAASTAAALSQGNLVRLSKPAAEGAGQVGGWIGATPSTNVPPGKTGLSLRLIDGAREGPTYTSSLDGRVFRFSGWVDATRATTRVFVRLRKPDGSFQSGSQGALVANAGEGWKQFSVDLDVIDHPSGWQPSIDIDGAGVLDADFYDYRIEDVTQARAAAASASSAQVFKDDAETAAGAAESAVISATAARDAASGSATAAATSATNAGASATASANSATASQSSRLAAESARDAASGSASAAATSASNASTSATSAGNSAVSATTARNEAIAARDLASGSASAAATSASSAGASATAAGLSATSATTMRNEAIAARDLASGSASAAASSASSAGASATNAGNSASAALTAKTNAESARDAAGASATTAQGAASTATSQAALAAVNASAAARLAAGNLVRTSDFTAGLGDWTAASGAPAISTSTNVPAGRAGNSLQIVWGSVSQRLICGPTVTANLRGQTVKVVAWMATDGGGSASLSLRLRLLRPNGTAFVIQATRVASSAWGEVVFEATITEDTASWQVDMLPGTGTFPATHRLFAPVIQVIPPLSSSVSQTLAAKVDAAGAISAIDSEVNAESAGGLATVRDAISAQVTLEGDARALRYVTVGANGRTATQTMGATDNGSIIAFDASRFQIWNGVGGEAPFEVSGGVTYIKAAKIKDADITRLKIAGEAVDTARLGANAATDFYQGYFYPYGASTFSGSWTTVASFGVNAGVTNITRLRVVLRVGVTNNDVVGFRVVIGGVLVIDIQIAAGETDNVQILDDIYRSISALHSGGLIEIQLRKVTDPFANRTVILDGFDIAFITHKR